MENILITSLDKYISNEQIFASSKLTFNAKTIVKMRYKKSSITYCAFHFNCELFATLFKGEN